MKKCPELDFIIEMDKHRHIPCIDRIQKDFEKGIVEVYRKLSKDLDMNVATDEEPELRATQYPKLRVLTGGKGPPEPPDDGVNWLAEYVVGTTFVARHRNSKEVDFNLYHVLFKSLPGVVLLKWELPDGKMLDYYVDPQRFSKQFVSPVILGVVQLEASQEDTNNGNSNRTDRPPDLVLNAPVPGGDPLVQESKEPEV